MEIGNRPRILFNVLKEQILSKYNNPKSEQNPVDRMEFADQVLLNVTEAFPLRVNNPYSVAGVKHSDVMIETGTIVDNDSRTADQIFVTTQSGKYLVTEQADQDNYPYVIEKYNEKFKKFEYVAEGIV